MPDIRAYLSNGEYKIFKNIPTGHRSNFLQKAIQYYVKNHPEQFPELNKKKDKDNGE